jgi:AAR2 C-terminal repeat region
LESIHPYLTPFPEAQEEGTRWEDVTRHVTPETLNRVLPPTWMFTSQTPSTNDDATDQLSSLPSARDESLLNFTKIDLKRTFNPLAVGRDRTDQILDKSYYLLSLAAGNTDTLLEELELSFLTVLCVNNFSGFETWKKLVILFCGCRAALSTHERLFREFLSILRAQFGMCSEETITEVILEGNFVSDNLKVPSHIRFADARPCTSR